MLINKTLINLYKYIFVQITFGLGIFSLGFYIFMITLEETFNMIPVSVISLTLFIVFKIIGIFFITIGVIFFGIGLGKLIEKKYGNNETYILIMNYIKKIFLFGIFLLLLILIYNIFYNLGAK